MLDLSLENLGVEVDPGAADDMKGVIMACGDSKSFREFGRRVFIHRRVALTQLDSPNSRRPAEKSALLVKAHKVIVGKHLHQNLNVRI